MLCVHFLLSEYRIRDTRLRRFIKYRYDLRSESSSDSFAASHFPLHVSLHTTPQRYPNKTMSDDSHLNPSGGNNNGNSHLPSSNTASEAVVTNDTLSVKVTTTTTGSSANSLATVRTASGPVVKCVLLKHMRSSGRDVHPHLDKSVLLLRAREKEEQKEEELNTKPAAISTTPTDEEHDTLPVANHHHQHPHHREVLTELIEECVVDTSPGKNEVQKLLGGNSFTFIGQYPDEGIVLMARADQFHDLDMIDDLTIRELKNFIRESGLGHIIDLTTVVDHADLIQAVKDAQLPLNPHRLQPPFDDCPIRGDILLMRVADDPNDEDDDDEDEDDDAGVAKMSAAIHQAMQQVKSAMEVPNDEFFLDYTKEEYIAFASRTDIVAEPMGDDEDDEDEEDMDEEDEDEQDEEEEDDDDEEEEDGLDDEEEEKHLVLNLILSELIKSFREDNGRGPDAEELLDLRARVAEQLKLELPPPAAPIPDEERKRKTIDDDHVPHSTSPSPKKVKFTPDILEQQDENDDDNDDDDDDDDIDATENGNNVKDDPNDEAPDDR